jgi:hypothetical protein
LGRFRPPYPSDEQLRASTLFAAHSDARALTRRGDHDKHVDVVPALDAGEIARIERLKVRVCGCDVQRCVHSSLVPQLKTVNTTSKRARSMTDDAQSDAKRARVNDDDRDDNMRSDTSQDDKRNADTLPPTAAAAEAADKLTDVETQATSDAFDGGEWVD